MNPSVASLVFALGIGGLFYLNRDKSARTSSALWIPVIWFWILGSRAVSVWLGGGFAGASANQMMDGSPTDAFVFLVLLVGGLAVLAVRGNRPLSLIASNWPIVLYFSYCLMSVVWSDYPDVTIKRWFKATGDVVMALVVVTDPQPVAALQRFFSRVGFILLPVSVLLIKYYPNLGCVYDTWSGVRHPTGVTTDKNLLGLTTYVLALGALWQVVRLWKSPDQPDRSRRLVAQCTLVGFGIWILCTANSVTSESCFIVGAVVMLALSGARFKGRPAAVHKFVLMIVILVGLIKGTGADAVVFDALGRKPDLTGRASDIWPLLIPMAPSASVGAGFESFWLGPRLQKVWDAFPNLYITEAHNGYIEVYLNLGAIGLGIIITLLVHGYSRAVAAFRNDSNSGSLMLAYILAATMYSYTEVGFRMLNCNWGFLLLAIMGASCISKPARANAHINRTQAEYVWSAGGLEST